VNPLQDYLARFTPLKPAPLLPDATPKANAQVALRWLVDESFRASKVMIRTHHKDDIIRFIVLAQILNDLGYTLQWTKFKGCVGITKAVKPMMNNLPKEVARHANAGGNGTGD